MAPEESRHQVEWVAAGLRRAAAERGVQLPLSYARAVAAEGLASGADLAVSGLGGGVVIQLAPQSKERLALVVGYADARGQWHRDGRRHLEPTSAGAEGLSEHEEVAL